MVVMKYAKNSSLRKNLQNIVNSKWVEKLLKLKDIISGLNIIHQKQLIHCDFHHGNILDQNYFMLISDLGLCKPVEYFQNSKKDDIYGVLPFIAPEILRGKSYTTASDIYSFSMIMWEFTSGIPPFDNRAHDFKLSLHICNGERPEITKNTPKCYVDLMKKCWDEDLLIRPNASEIKNIIENWIQNVCNRKIFNKSSSEGVINEIIEFYKADKNLKEQVNVLHTSESHSQAYHTSRLLDFTKQLNKILNQKKLVEVKSYGMFYFYINFHYFYVLISF